MLLKIIRKPKFFFISGVKGLWLELAIVADHTVVKFHGRERVNHYILALMNIVSWNFIIYLFHDKQYNICFKYIYLLNFIFKNIR